MRIIKVLWNIYDADEEWGVFVCKGCDVTNGFFTSLKRQREYPINERILVIKGIKDTIKIIDGRSAHLSTLFS